MTVRETQILAFGSFWLDRLFGRDQGGPVALAGGAFRSVVHGGPVRDLDLWFPDPEGLARARLCLLQQGAGLVADRPPYQCILEVRETPVDLVYNVHPTDLHALFASFDLGPAMMGVWRQEGVTTALIHPLARASYEARTVRVNRDYTNQKYVLVTLVRLARYAREMGFAEEEADRGWLWSVFDGASEDEQQRMVDRFRRVGLLPDAVLAEALRRQRRRAA